jgi:RNA polymerase sigma-70 factor, ECF subfamily
LVKALSVIKLKTSEDNVGESEAELIERVKRGDEQAFSLLVAPLECKMLTVAINLCNDQDEADDVYQEAMINAYKALPAFKFQSKFSTWLYRIVINTAMSHKRKLKRNLNKLLHLKQAQDSAVEYFDTRSAAPESEIYQRQLSSAINGALQKLAHNERIAFALCHLQELKIADAAYIMECTDGAVKSFVFRAREKMRVQLKEYHR